MIKILYFASLAESLGLKSEDFEADANDISGLVETLRARGEPYASAFSGDANVLSAVNQEMASIDTTIKPGDEVAFFPPVTGG